VQHDAQLAQGPEDLDAEHEDDEQARQPHRARLDAIHAERQRGHRADGDPASAMPRVHVGASTHGALKQRAPFVLEQAAARRALAEGLELGSPCSVSRNSAPYAAYACCRARLCRLSRDAKSAGAPASPRGGQLTSATGRSMNARR